MTTTTYVCNAFSLQMVKHKKYSMNVEQVDTLPEGLTSAIGHADTAAVLGYPVNRLNVELYRGDTIYVAQLMGGRLPEGSTTLPDGFFFKYFKIEIV